jgi:hypothetical protein
MVLITIIFYILDDENNTLIKGAKILPCNQNISEEKIVSMKNINFIATIFIDRNRYINI